MNADELSHGFSKALEVWSLQSLCNVAILLPFVIVAIIAGRASLEALKSRLTLRLVSEGWETFTDLGVDVLMLLVALTGILVINPDVMADIKVALPFVPAGIVLVAAALVVRTLYGGRKVGSGAWKVTIGLLVVACALNWFGFTFVMEGAGHEYLELHPGAHVWESLAKLRSNQNPDLTMTTFLATGPALLLVFLWAVVRGAGQSLRWSGSGGERVRAGTKEDDTAHAGSRLAPTH